MVKRFIGTGRLQEGGLLATHKQDHNAHITGGDWRHDATHIDMAPPLLAFPADNVQGTFELISGFAASTGTGFVSVGDVTTDGYATGSYNVGTTTTPTFRDAILAAFGDGRLENGGTVFILPGTYKLNTTVEVPSGISIMGAIAGTIIIGEMVEEPMFRLLSATDFFTVGGDSGSGDLSAETVNPVDETKIFNLILADNLDGYVSSSGQPVSSMQTVPMIEIQRGSRVYFENVKFLGRVNNGTQDGREKTLRAIGYSSTASVGTHLLVKNCYFDGMATAIRFDPGNGDLDFITVDNCKARTFGSEDIADLSILANNCFVATTLCNGKFTNNHHVSIGTFPTDVTISCVVVTSASTGSGGSDINFILIGNTGGNNQSLSPLLLATEIGVTINSFKQIQYGNSWGSAVSNTWFVTVGQQDASGFGASSGIGDFLGAGAIDLLMATDMAYPTTVIINPGTYIVTLSGSNRYNLVGNAINESIPTLSMNLTSATTDEAGNRVFSTGPRIENILFKSDALDTVNYHSIRPNGADGAHETVIVKNCQFVNTTLSVYPGTQDLAQCFVTTCRFNQNGSFDDNISLLLPNIENSVIEDCYFDGYGYVGLIGEDSGISYFTNKNDGLITIRNCVMNRTDRTITGQSPLTIDAYLVISTPGQIILQNCNIITDNTLGSITTSVDSSLDTTFLRFVYVNARDLFVDNCLVHGPNQTFDVVGTNYPLPALEVVTHSSGLFHSVRITNSKIYFGMPLRIGGSISTPQSSGILVDGNEFYTDTAIGTTSLVDIELSKSAINNPSVIFTNNRAHITGSLNYELVPRHIDGLITYDATGLVQIYAEDHNIFFQNNNIVGVIGEFSESGVTLTGHNHLSGCVLDNTNNGGADDAVSINASSNHIAVESDYNTDSASDSTSALHVRGANIIISDNFIQNGNRFSVDAAGIHALWVENRYPTGGTSLSTNVTGNMISSSLFDGYVGSGNNNGFIYVGPNTEADGIVSNNIYSIATDDDFGSLNSAIFTSDISGLARWITQNNKNETITLEIRGSSGTYAVDGVVKGNPNAMTSYIEVENAVAVNEVVQFLHTDAGSTVIFEWWMNLLNYIPLGALISEVSVIHQHTISIPDTTNDLTINVDNTVGGNSITVNPSTSQDTAILTPTSKYNDPGAGLWLGITATIDSDGAEILEIQGVTVTYRL